MIRPQRPCGAGRIEHQNFAVRVPAGFLVLVGLSGTMCYDSNGRAYVLPGRERFAGYLL